jgi:hypothetical protein
MLLLRSELRPLIRLLRLRLERALSPSSTYSS